MRCIMLFYNDLSDSPAGDMSSLFGIVNFICPFCILLCIYTFYYVLPLDNIGYCILLLTWRFRLLWWCFLLSIWQCKVLYPIVQFYILLCTKICYHPRLGNFENFLFCFAFPYYDLFDFVKLYYAYVIYCMTLSEQKLSGQAGEWALYSATLPFPAIHCQKWRTMSPVMLQPETIFTMCCLIFWDS